MRLTTGRENAIKGNFMAQLVSCLIFVTSEQENAVLFTATFKFNQSCVQCL